MRIEGLMDCYCTGPAAAAKGEKMLSKAEECLVSCWLWDVLCRHHVDVQRNGPS